MPRIEVLLPAPGDAIDLDRAALRGWLADRYARSGDAWVRVNLVAALGGQTTGSDGTSDGLTGGIDRLLLSVLRRSADVVLVGAGTLRAERLRMPRTAALAVATRRGDLDAAVLPEPAEDGRRALVLCPQRVAALLRDRLGDRARVVPVDGDPSTTPSALVDALAALGLHRIVCEGGAELAGRLVTAGIVDELDLTTAPLLAGGGPSLRALGGPWTLAGLLHDETDRLYARWLPPRR
ncbi:MAG: pyrimidine reductase [Acidobacteria bacterium]|nr:pyrimidine reductase [Acidobacteriota bacterium]